jgi:hypothetical protein
MDGRVATLSDVARYLNRSASALSRAVAHYRAGPSPRPAINLTPNPSPVVRSSAGRWFSTRAVPYEIPLGADSRYEDLFG